ncbi:uncharacterized protein [Primulina eburnea]|uniref:uncharacterized protein n=1 Tax=Primulina eburnea TaxID=1245227 RepID=UPI003C6BF6E8
MDPRRPGRIGRTRFYVDGMNDVKDSAQRALDFYNQKQEKIFSVEKVAKLNIIFGRYEGMTFWARNAGSDELCLFRGGVGARDGQVYLCEMKDDEEGLQILENHDENYEPS